MNRVRMEAPRAAGVRPQAARIERRRDERERRERDCGHRGSTGGSASGGMAGTSASGGTSGSAGTGAGGAGTSGGSGGTGRQRREASSALPLLTEGIAFSGSCTRQISARTSTTPRSAWRLSSSSAPRNRALGRRRIATPATGQRSARRTSSAGSTCSTCPRTGSVPSAAKKRCSLGHPA